MHRTLRFIALLFKSTSVHPPSAPASIIFQLSLAFIVHRFASALENSPGFVPRAELIQYIIRFRSNFRNHSFYRIIFIFRRISHSFGPNLFVLFQFNFDQCHSSKLFRGPVSTVTYKSLVCILNDLTRQARVSPRLYYFIIYTLANGRL